jgi:hypothetical protein
LIQSWLVDLKDVTRLSECSSSLADRILPRFSKLRQHLWQHWLSGRWHFDDHSTVAERRYIRSVTLDSPLGTLTTIHSGERGLHRRDSRFSSNRYSLRSIWQQDCDDWRNCTYDCVHLHIILWRDSRAPTCWPDFMWHSLGTLPTIM